jgi:replicative DNA helicase
MSDFTATLPNDREAECALVGSLLLDPERVASLNGSVKPEHFYDGAVRTIYQTIKAMQAEKQPVDLTTLTARLRAKNRLDAVGGVAFVTELFAAMPTAALAGQYASIIREAHALRETITACTEASTRCHGREEGAQSIIGQLTAKLADIATSGHAAPRRAFKDSIMAKMERMESDKADEDVVVTGIGKIDELSPVRMGDMPVIAGAAKSGKSILSLTLAANIANAGGGVLYFSLEDREPKIVDRLVAGQSKVPVIRHHHSTMREDDQSRFLAAASRMAKWRMTIRDDVFDAEDICAIARAEKAAVPGLSAVFVDYLQLVRGERRKSDSREVEVAGVSRKMRLLAMELAVPVFILSQVNKEGDTRESKAIENDCTAVWRIDFTDDNHGERGVAIPIQRNGESGVYFKVSFLGSIARVENHHDEKHN